MRKRPSAKKGKPARRRGRRIKVRAYIRNGRVIQSYTRLRAKPHTRKRGRKRIPVRGYVAPVPKKPQLTVEDKIEAALQAGFNEETIGESGEALYKQFAEEYDLTPSEIYSIFRGSDPRDAA